MRVRLHHSKQWISIYEKVAEFLRQAVFHIATTIGLQHPRPIALPFFGQSFHLAHSIHGPPLLDRQFRSVEQQRDSGGFPNIQVVFLRLGRC